MNPLKSLLQRALPASAVVRLRALDYRLRSAQEHRLLSSLCDRSRAAVDIGANLGTLTCWLARYSSHVYAYEPNPELAQRLRAAFRDENVTVVQTALSDVAGSALLRVPHFHGVEMHSLGSIVQAFTDADQVREFSVPLRRLDDEDLPDIGFLKIDAEQNEERVLRGAMALIERHRPHILLEVTPKLYAKPLLEFFADFLALGYRAFFLYEGKLLAIERYRMDVHNDSRNYGVPGKYMTNVVLTERALL